MKEQPYRFDFVVPDDVNIEEPVPEGKTVFDGKVIPNPTLEALRVSLDSDPRWNLKRVAPLRPDGDRQHRQHLIAWVSIPADGAALQEAQRDIQEIVVRVVPGVLLGDIDQTSL